MFEPTRTRACAARASDNPRTSCSVALAEKSFLTLLLASRPH
ncbi:MAG TPA: hypothetical protein VFV67_12190 [Actinophytocola sp.]|nr:hypothetical protein [Actinophytocola sp.]HEU5471405.1 hypothetical protein [Actinophytocola sp.]